MPLNTERPPADSRQEFCLALKAARERKGITLGEIAETTKIPASLFAALERSDLRRWPKGLFRRSFFRDYARTIGLATAEVCEEFARLFPDDGRVSAKGTDAVDAARGADDLRLALDSTWHGPRTSVLVRLLAALIDAAAITLVSAGLTRLASIDLAPVMAVVSLAYFSLGTLLFGESPAKHAMTRGASIPGALTDAVGYVFGKVDEASPAEPVEEPPMPEWITDARRVGPASGLRVRIKVSP